MKWLTHILIVIRLNAGTSQAHQECHETQRGVGSCLHGGDKPEEHSDREGALTAPRGQCWDRRCMGPGECIGGLNPDLSSQEDFWEEVTSKKRPEWSELQSEVGPVNTSAYAETYDCVSVIPYPPFITKARWLICIWGMCVKKNIYGYIIHATQFLSIRYV